MLKLDAFLKGHDEFNRKTPKDGISGTIRLEGHGIRLDLFGGDKWGGLDRYSGLVTCF